MKKTLLLASLFCIAAFTVKAQDTVKTTPDAPLIIYGSVDTYFKFDFADKGSQIPTSFASDHNSISIGMVDIGLKKKVGKASFVGEIAFGPRGQEQSILPGASGDSYHIQNLYVGYDITDKLNVTGGFMATFVGYEVISPAANFNYSTSYLFTNGPFQNAGVKFTYAFSDKVSLMAGAFNDAWNVYTSTQKVNTFGAQLMVAPVKGWTAYLNLVTGKLSGTEVDLTTAYQITDAFKLGLNAADYSAAKAVGTGGFTGAALYPQIAVSKTVTFGLRGEYFKTKSGSVTTFGPDPGASVTAFTLTANIKSGPLALIPEVRLDNGSKESFLNHSGDPSKTASQFVLAAVYSF